ncbi:MAG TPA: cupin [Pseudoxanthomonas sp.]|nr:cupin [Pseudoxanthomonas sp.]
MPNAAINLWDKFAKFADLGSPRVIAETGNCQLKLVKLLGKEVWRFPADRIVLVLDGELMLGLHDGAVWLSAGEMYVVPRDTEHHPLATDECSVMLVEPKIERGASVMPAEIWV